MPILQIDIVGDRGEDTGLAQRLADAAGAALGSRPQGTWVKLQYIAASDYAENSGANVGPPILVSLLEADVGRGAELRERVRLLAEAVAKAANHPVQNVHIIVEPAARGRIAFGGELVE